MSPEDQIMQVVCLVHVGSNLGGLFVLVLSYVALDN